jgi:putative transposase
LQYEAEPATSDEETGDQPLGAPEMVNQMWALDFMRDTLYEGRNFRLLNVIDEDNREVHRMRQFDSIISAGTGDV